MRGRAALGVRFSCQAVAVSEELGQLVELEVTNVAHQGVGVARLDGRVVFVSDAIPGERVVARLTEVSRKKFWRAVTVRVVEASPHRREHVWLEASVDRAPELRAGGADFGHIELGHQRELKRRVLVDSLQRFASVSSDVSVEPVCDGAGWRTRVRLHVGADGVPGPFAARSHSVVPVASLPLAVPQLHGVAPLRSLFDPGSVVDVVAPSAGDPVVLVTAPPRDVQRDRSVEAPVIAERVGAREFRLDATGFWQVHFRAAETLSAAVASMIDRDRFDPAADNLDLYGGVGLLAAALADVGGMATRVTSVESSARATLHAVDNLADIEGADAVTDRVDRFLRRRVAGDASAVGATVVLDPPRAGAGREVVDSIARLGPAQVVYVACDPVAFARDVGFFGERGWSLVSLRAFDLFPHTHHVEAIGLLLPDNWRAR